MNTRSSKYFLVIRLGLIFVAGAPTAFAAIDWDAARAKVAKLGELKEAPAMVPAEGVAPDGTMRAIFYDALPWKGKPTRVYAWLGMPTKEQAKGKAKVPGVVLVHGGGGTAFKAWVKRWNEAGFAAISIAVEGQTEMKSPAKDQIWTPHAWAGPARKGIYHDSDQPLEDQWMYHAVADTVLAHSLLRSLPQVDAQRVGLVGISWGGVITSTVMGIDSRFAFAIPIYGCGHLAEAANQYGKSLGNNDMYRKVWDPMLRMEQAQMPSLWLSWPMDQHFPLDSQAICYRATSGPHVVSLVPGMRHGHGAGWVRPESVAFAQSVVATGKPWAEFVRAGVTPEGQALAVFRSARPLDRAELVSTTDGGVSGSRKWVVAPASVERKGAGYGLRAPLPAGTTAWFLNGVSGGIVVSSEYQEVPGRPAEEAVAERNADPKQPDTF